LSVAGVALLAIPIVEWVRFSYFDLLWPDVLLLAGRLASLLGFVLLFIQFVLSSRIRVFESSIGLDRLIAFHRLVGISVLGLFLFHPIALTAFELFLGYVSLTAGKLLGIATIILLVTTAGVALMWKAWRWRYETWKRIHYVNYAVLPIGLLHATRIGSTVNSSVVLNVYYYTLVGLYLVIVAVKVIRRAAVHRTPYTVAHVERENHDITSIYLDGPPLVHLAGQFLMINVAKERGYSESHPYTISSSPFDPQIRISAKAIGDFSAGLRDTRVGARALVEAPYGAFSYNRVVGEPLVFVAGGIGITPFLSQLGALRATGDATSVTLLWGNKAREDIAFAGELAAFERELAGFRVVHVLSDERWDGECGFVDAALIRKYVQEIDEAEFFLCGPPAMMDAVRGSLGELGVPRPRIHFERFSLG